MSDKNLQARKPARRWLSHAILVAIVVACLFVISILIPENHRAVREYTDQWFGIETFNYVATQDLAHEIAETTSTTNDENTDFVLDEAPNVDEFDRNSPVVEPGFVESTQSAHPVDLDRVAAVKIELLTALLNIDGGTNLDVALRATERAINIAKSAERLATVVPMLEIAVESLQASSQFDVSLHQRQLNLIGDAVSRISFSAPSDEGLNPTSYIVEDVANSQTQDSSLWDELTDGIGSVYKVRRTESRLNSDVAIPAKTNQVQVLILLERARGHLIDREFGAYVAVLDDLAESLRLEATVGDAQASSLVTQIEGLRVIEATDPRDALITALNAIAELDQVESTSKGG